MYGNPLTPVALDSALQSLPTQLTELSIRADADFGLVAHRVIEGFEKDLATLSVLRRLVVPELGQSECGYRIWYERLAIKELMAVAEQRGIRVTHSKQWW